MQNAAEATLREIPALAPVPRPPTPCAGELIRRLAADRLRTLVDDGVTLSYVARMYGIPIDQMERLRSELIPSRR